MSKISTLEEMLDEKNEELYHEIGTVYPIEFKENSEKLGIAFA